MRLITKITSTLLLTFGLANASEYIIDNSHTTVGFSVKHMMITNVKGDFKTYDGMIDFDKDKKTFKVLKASIDTNSIDTANEKRDEHLRSEDFFASEKFPKMTFEMTSYKTNGDEGEVTGNLTIRGITKAIKLKVEDISTIKDFKGQNRVGFTLEGKINRLDYDLKWNKLLEAGGVAVAEDVKIIIDIEAVEK
jgi:polyisoprenoid-binding protein YceI